MQAAGMPSWFKMIHLVFHQIDQGGDDEGDLFHHQRGNLVQIDFPPPVGTDCKGVVPVEMLWHASICPGRERGVAEYVPNNPGGFKNMLLPSKLIS